MLTEGFYFYFYFFYELSMVVIVVFCGACVSWFLISFILYLMAFFFPMSQLLLGICKTVHILSSWTRKLLFKGCLAKNLVGQLTHFGIFDGDV